MKIKFECNSKREREAAEQFLTWLCEQGEQDYWTWQENQDDPVTIQRFDYDFKKNAATCELRSE